MKGTFSYDKANPSILDILYKKIGYSASFYIEHSITDAVIKTHVGSALIMSCEDALWEKNQVSQESPSLENEFWPPCPALCPQGRAVLTWGGVGPPRKAPGRRWDKLRGLGPGTAAPQTL